MDRERAVQYFKDLGFTSTSLYLNSQQRYLGTPADKLVVAGDGIVSRKDWTHSSSNLKKDKQIPKQVEEGCKPHVEPLDPLFTPRSKTPRALSTVPTGPISVCTVCTCSGKVLRPRPPSAAPVVHSNSDIKGFCSDSESDSDSDEEGLSLDRLLGMVSRLNERPSTTTASTTLLRLASSFTSTLSLTEQHLNQLLEFLKKDGPVVVKEVCLTVLDRLLVTEWGWSLLTQSHIVDKVISLIGQSSLPSVQILAMGVLDKLLNVPEVDYAQIQERLEDEVYPCVFNFLHGKAGLDVKYAACCILRSLARDVDFATRIKKDNLFLRRQLRDSSARLREVYVGVLMAVLAHPGLTEPGSVDTGVLPVVKGLLRDGPCESQKQGLDLLHCVMSDQWGVQAVTGDQRMVASVMACLLASQCRRVRAQASLVAMALTSVHREHVARGVLEGVSHYVHPQEAVEVGVGGGSVARVTYPVPAKNQAEAHMWHNLDCFLDSVAGLFRSEGLVEMETDCLYSELPLRGDVGTAQLTCLSHLLQLMVNVCTWPMHRRLVGTGNAQVVKPDLTHLCDDFSLREKFSGLNHRLAIEQWKRFGPSVFAVLHWLAQRIALHIDREDNVAAGITSVASLGSGSRTSSRPSSANSAKENNSHYSSSAKCAQSSRPSSAKSARENTAPDMSVYSSSAKVGRSSRPSSAKSSRETRSSPPRARPASAKLPQGRRSSQALSRPASAKLPPGRSFSQASSRPASAKAVTVLARDVLVEAEWCLLKSLLNFLLCMTLVSCKKFADPLSQDSSPTNSHTTTSVSPSKKTAVAKGLWVSENPHLTQVSHKGAPHDQDRKQQKQLDKEVMTDRRAVRRGMYNEGMFAAMATLVQLADPEVKTMCGLILRAVVQPLDETVAPPSAQGNKDRPKQSTKSSVYSTFGDSSDGTDVSNNRPQSAHTIGKTEKAINIALHRMSSSSASVVRDALGPCPHSAARRSPDTHSAVSPHHVTGVKVSSKESLGLRPMSAASSLRSNTPLSVGRPDSVARDGDDHYSASLRCQSQLKLRPLIQGQPINRECQREAVEQCGRQVLQSLFSRSHRVKLFSLTFLHDLVKHSTAELHMELSKIGIIPKLLDFVQINDDSEELEVLGLKVLQLLVTSEERLRQLFSRLGGHRLLMVLVTHTNTNVRCQVRDTLAAVTRGQGFEGRGHVKGQRPASAPVKCREDTAPQVVGQAVDIWDDIMHRWGDEDKVVAVLQKFLKPS
ncbi:uncharacterized protein [Littorina saxatilis]|uniref:Uncharacterized protein n=1 Tax=Littorina saxatilis TaxID=31220 RepID=A0AAN9BKE2_9CAEN